MLSGSRLSVMDLWWPWKFSQKSKSYRFDKHLYCIILVFLLIWLQSSHWISRHGTYNQYFVCLEFAVSIILWPYMKWGQGHTISSFSCLKYINVNSVTIHRLVLGIWHRQSPFCLNFEVLVPMWPWKIGQCHTISISSLSHTHVSLGRIRQLVQKKAGTQTSVTPLLMLMQTGYVQKSIYSPSSEVEAQKAHASIWVTVQSTFALCR